MIGILFVLTLAVTIVSASSYSIEFNQIQDKIIVKESVDGVKISNYVSADKLDKSSGGYYFVRKMIFNESYKTAIVKLNLDIGFILEEDGIFPEGYKTESDGQIISVVWNLENINKDDNFAVFVKIKDTRIDYTYVWVGFILILIAAYIAYRKFGKKRRVITRKIVGRAGKEKPAREEARYEHLLDTEKKVIDLLKNADRNELWQRQIQNATGFSKAKVSRLVRNLEARGLIVKIPFGNTNKVRLK